MGSDGTEETYWSLRQKIHDIHDGHRGHRFILVGWKFPPETGKDDEDETGIDDEPVPEWEVNPPNKDASRKLSDKTLLLILKAEGGIPQETTCMRGESVGSFFVPKTIQIP